MSVSVYIYLEWFDGKNWQVLKNKNRPINIAPMSWGKYNFGVYYEQSGERDLPFDLSLDLQSWIKLKFLNAINRPSWMTAKEIKHFYRTDLEGKYSHIHLSQNSAIEKKRVDLASFDDKSIRIVFWAD